MRDSTDDSTRKRKEAVPGVIGMNIISECRDMLSSCESAVDEDLNEVFAENSVFDNRYIHGFARVKGTCSVRIPANTAIVVECLGQQIDGDVIVDPLTNGGHLHHNFRTVPTCVTVSKGKLWARVTNIGDEDIYLKPRTMIGNVSKCDVENKNSSIWV